MFRECAWVQTSMVNPGFWKTTEGGQQERNVINSVGSQILQSFIWYFPKIEVPRYRRQNTIILIMGTPKQVPVSLGNPHIAEYTKDEESP